VGNLHPKVMLSVNFRVALRTTSKMLGSIAPFSGKVKPESRCNIGVKSDENLLKVMQKPKIFENRQNNLKELYLSALLYVTNSGSSDKGHHCELCNKLFSFSVETLTLSKRKLFMERNLEVVVKLFLFPA
jgi:hypothetical protein